MSELKFDFGKAFDIGYGCEIQFWFWNNTKRQSELKFDFGNSCEHRLLEWNSNYLY